MRSESEAVVLSGMENFFSAMVGLRITINENKYILFYLLYVCPHYITIVQGCHYLYSNKSLQNDIAYIMMFKKYIKVHYVMFVTLLMRCL